MILDVHTHSIDRSNAIVNLSPQNYMLLTDRLCSVGIHPWHCADEDVESQFAVVQKAVETDARVLAVGETGLDACCGVDEARQRSMMEQHIALSETRKKPLIVHCVRRSNEIIALHRRMRPSQPWVIHGFRGNVNIAKSLLDEGLYLSVGELFNADAVKLIPLNRLLVETDESNLAVTEIVSRIAAAQGADAEELTRTMARNAETVFGRL